MKTKWEGLVTGTSKSHQRVQPESMMKLAVNLPDKELMECFNQIVANVLERKNTCTVEAQQLSTIRDVLLPRLINGELKLV